MSHFKSRHHFLSLWIVAVMASSCGPAEEGQSQLQESVKTKLAKAAWNKYVRPALISWGLEKAFEKGTDLVIDAGKAAGHAAKEAIERDIIQRDLKMRVDNYNREMLGSTYDPTKMGLTAENVAQNYWIPLADANGDGKTDAIIVRPGPEYHIRGGETFRWGDPGDIPFFGDMNGDGQVELNVYRPSTSVFYSRNGQSRGYGNPGDIPYVADFNGDGRTEYGLYRPSTARFYIEGVETHFGNIGDVPLIGDFNGDGKSDIALYRPSNATFYIHGGSAQGIHFGNIGDIPVIGDYDGDGKDDIALYRPSAATFYIHGGSAQGIHFGDPGDIPVCADYDGDGATDIAVYRVSTANWYIYGKGNFQYGDPGDFPGTPVR